MEYVKLCDVCDFQGGSQPPKEEWSFDLKKGYVRMLQIRDFTQKEKVAPEYVKVTTKTRMCEPDDILIARYGASLGKILTGLSGAYNVAIIKTIPNTSILEKRYLYYYLKSQVFQRFLVNVGSRAAQAGFNKNDLQKLLIPKLTKEEQRKTVDVLENVEMIIDVYQQQLAKLDELVKARFVEMFSDTRAEEPLATLCTFIDYRGKTPEKAERGLPFITAKNIKMHHMSFETKEFISKETYDKVMTRGFPKVGDVVFTTEAPLGNVCRIPYMKTEFYIGQRIITMQTKALEPVYLEYALSSDDFKRKILEKSSGSTVTGIRSKLLEQLTIPVPPIAQQQKFAAFVGQIEKIRLFIQKNIEKIETLKKALMQKYFE